MLAIPAYLMRKISANVNNLLQARHFHNHIITTMSVSVADSTTDAMTDPRTLQETEYSREEREFDEVFASPWELPPLTMAEDALLQTGPYHNNEAANPATHPRDRPVPTDYDSREPVHFRKRKLWAADGAAPVEVDLPSSFYDLR